MNDQQPDSAIANLRAELARVRRLVLLLAAPWLLVIFGALAPHQSDVVTAREFVVVDEKGVQRAVLAAPTEMVPPAFHSEPVPTSVPRLMLNYEDGREIMIGGRRPVIRVTSKDKEWWAGVQASGFFSVQENESVSASTIISPFNLSVTVEGDHPYRDISLEMFGTDDRPEIVISEGDHEKALRAR